MRALFVITALLISCALASSITDIIEAGYRDYQQRFGQKRSAWKSMNLPDKIECGTQQVAHDINVPMQNIREQLEKQGYAKRAEQTTMATLSWHQLRIKYDTSAIINSPNRCTYFNQSITLPSGEYFCKLEDIIDSTIETLLIENIIPTTLNVLTSLVSVYGPEDRLYLSAAFYNVFPRCGWGQVDIPVEYIEGNEGLPEADMWIGFSALPYPSQGTIASAQPCSWEIKYGGLYRGRTLAAAINFAPRYLHSVNPSRGQYHRYIRTLLHEFLHTLGIDQYMLDVGDYEKAAIYLVKNMERGIPDVPRWTGPSVADFAQKHFNCSTINGFEIEYNGGPGSAGAHWKGRVAADEIMAAYILFNPVLSNLTLGLLEDTGLYHVNWSMAEILQWGKDRGCDFAMQKCVQASSWSDYFCNQDPSIPTCTFDRSGGGFCGLQLYQDPLPEVYTYFNDPKAGGSLETLDYCPIIMPSGNSFCNNIELNNDANLTKVGMEFRTEGDSMCLIYRSDEQYRLGCFRFRCDENNILYVHLFSEWIPCGNADASKRILCPQLQDRFCELRNKKVEVYDHPVINMPYGDGDFFIPQTSRNPSGASTLIMNMFVVLTFIIINVFL